MRKLTFIFAFLLTLLGGTRAWADTVIVNGSTIADGWSNGVQGSIITTNQFTVSTDDNCLKAATSGTAGFLTSNSAITISEGQRIVISSKCHSTTTSSTKIIIKTSENGDFSTSGSYTDKETFSNSLLCSSEGYTEIVSAPLTAGTYFLRLSCAYTSINSVKICDSYELSLDESKAMVFNSSYTNKVPFKVSYTAVNGWNTICLPFSFSDIKSQLFGDNHSVYELDSYTSENSTLSFKKSSYISANRPYLVYVTNAPSSPQTISVSDTYVGFNTVSSHISSKGDATFQGTYAPMSMEGKYGVTSSGKVMQGSSSADIKGYRAYFTGISAPSNGARPTIVLEDDGTTTDLGFVKMLDEDAKAVYTLSGQRIQKAGKGLYIVNGRKVVLK